MRSTSLRVAIGAGLVRAGDYLEALPPPPWYVRWWRWGVYFLAGRVPCHWVRVVHVHESTITVDRPIEAGKARVVFQDETCQSAS